MLFGVLRLDVPIRHVEVVGRLPDSPFGILTAMGPFWTSSTRSREGKEELTRGGSSDELTRTKTEQIEEEEGAGGR